MSVNATDNKFGLPKPDFQELPKKKVVWPFFVIFAIVVVLLIAAKMGYKFYFQTFGRNHPLASAQLQSSGSTSHQAKDGRSAKERVDVNGAVNPGAAPKHKKNPKVKESISATQKQLAAKQNKSLIKPGTYQELKTPQGIYHLVVISHLDKRFAMQEVQRLIKKNLGVCLILPRLNKGEKYYRVTIGHSKTEYEADKKLKHFKSAYKNIFVLKY